MTIDAASTVSGDVRTLDATVTTAPGATIGGTVSSLDKDLVAAGAVLAPAILLFLLGFALVGIVAGPGAGRTRGEPGPKGRIPDHP